MVIKALIWQLYEQYFDLIQLKQRSSRFDSATMSKQSVFVVCFIILSVATGKPTAPFSPEDEEPMPGAFRAIVAIDDEVKEIASFAANALSSSINTGPVEVIRIISAEKQVVAGLNYALQLELKPSDGEELFICDVAVLEQPWLNSRTVTQSNCSLKDVSEEE